MPFAVVGVEAKVSDRVRAAGLNVSSRTDIAIESHALQKCGRKARVSAERATGFQVASHGLEDHKVLDLLQMDCIQRKRKWK